MAHLLFLHVFNRRWVLSHALRVFHILNQIQAFSIFHLSSVVATGSKVIFSAGTEIGWKIEFRPIQPTFWSHCWNVHIIFCVLNKSQLFIFFWNKLLELPKLLLSPVKTLNFIQSIIIILMVCSEKMQILLKVCNGAVKFTLMFELRSWEFVWEDASKLLDYVRRQMFDKPWKKTWC